MKKILIDKICLRYFKGVENKEIVLGDNINVVKGRNGIGKSTIADTVPTHQRQRMVSKADRRTLR